MDKVIVTGSEGFIGKVLCERLKKKNVEVIRIDRHLGIEAIGIGNYLDKDVIAVFHLAAQTSVFNDDITQIIGDNIVVFAEVVKQCNEHGVKLVYASSSTAFDQNTTSLYGLSKSFDEDFARLYARNATGVRLHNVYGPEQRPGTLLHALTTQKEVTLFNNGENIRCFTHVDDAVEGLIAAYGYNNRLINVVNYEPTRIADFANEVAKYNGVKIILSPEIRERDHVQQTVDRNLLTVPLTYRNYKVGIKEVFGYGRTEGKQ